MVNPHRSATGVEIEAYLDSGAQRSLFDGSIARMVGLDLLAGRRLQLATAAGTGLEAFVHAVGLSHPELGQFELEVGFSSGHVRRNLLGRDFFNLVQIGFRERHSLFYLSPHP
jgi:hypothetical protein